jgi:hypothetical protein
MKSKEQLAEEYCNKIYQEAVKEEMYAPDVYQSKKDFLEGFIAAEKQIKDLYNHYNSKLKETTVTKLERRERTEYAIRLEAKVVTLKIILDK